MQGCDLLPSCVLGLSVWAVGETGEPALVGSTVMPLFSKKGRLKCGFQKLQLCPGVPPDLQWPSSTPGKTSVSTKGVQGRLDQKLKQLERRELPRCSWLDRKTLKAVADKQAAEPQVRRGTACCDCTPAGSSQLSPPYPCSCGMRAVLCALHGLALRSRQCPNECGIIITGAHVLLN